jgi:site-specific recombinase XerD
MMDLDPLIEGYLSYLAQVGRKVPRTVIDVRCSLRHVSQMMDLRHPGTPLWRLRFEDFLHWIEGERSRGRTSSTLAKNVSHIRGFLEYAWRSGRSERNVLDGFSLQDARTSVEPNHLTLEEARRLVLACPQAAARERRERVMILLLYGCGLRTGELCALDVGDINRERQELLVRTAKNDRPRVIPIPNGVYTEVLAYLLDHGKRGALFRTAVHSRRIRSTDVCDVVQRAAQRAGLRADVTARTLRHSFATHLMDRGVDLAIIASLMGHRSPQETGVYLHVLPGRAEQAVGKLSRGEAS